MNASLRPRAYLHPYDIVCDVNAPESLKKQLERARFERALEVTESMGTRRVLLTTVELARLNNMLTGKAPEHEPWRQEPVSLTLKSGKTAVFNVVTDPKVSLRDQLHRATELAENGHVIDAAVDIYAGLVLLHAFTDANRRTAVLAAHYFMIRYGVPLSGLALHEIGLGDLREPGQVEVLKDTIHQIAKFVQKRN